MAGELGAVQDLCETYYGVQREISLPLLQRNHQSLVVGPKKRFLATKKKSSLLSVKVVRCCTDLRLDCQVHHDYYEVNMRRSHLTWRLACGEVASHGTKTKRPSAHQYPIESAMLYSARQSTRLFAWLIPTGLCLGGAVQCL